MRRIMEQSSPITGRLNRPPRIFLILLFLFLFGIGSAHSAPSEQNFPFDVGEKLTYRVSWEGIAVGRATIEVLPGNGYKNVPSYHFIMRTTTNDRVNWFYRVREIQESYTDRHMTRTLAYVKSDTGTHPRNIRVGFDWDRMEATYQNGGEKRRCVTIIPGTFDPLSFLFVMRTKDLKTGRVIDIPITDGKKLIRSRASVLRKERISAGGKSYDAFLVMPAPGQLGNALGRKDAQNLMVWFGDDEKKRPVKIVTRFAVGRFVFELIPEETTRS